MDGKFWLQVEGTGFHSLSAAQKAQVSPGHGRRMDVTFSKPQETGNNCIGLDVDAIIVIPGGHFSAGLDAEVELGRGEVWKPVGSRRVDGEPLC